MSLAILEDGFGNTGCEALVMGENRGGHGCKARAYRVKERWAMGVRPKFAAISRRFGGKSRNNGGKFRQDGGKSRPYIRSRGFSHTQHARFYLARLLERKGDREGSGKLRTEILKLYPDALTHRGGRMADSFRKAE